MVRRFERKTYAPTCYCDPDYGCQCDAGTTYDIYYVDRLTGAEVMRYDGADPANTSPAYGAKSDKECLASRGYDLDEEVEISRCVVEVDLAEADRLKEMKARNAERAREEEEALDLLNILGDEAKAFNFEQWSEGESTVLRPALERRGYTGIRFYMVEQDSFGPLIRGCVATCHCGKRVRFFYG
jgi:hypothetical protein